MPSTPPEIGRPAREARTGREDRGQRGNKWWTLVAVCLGTFMLLLDANITFHGVLVQDDGDRTRALAALLGQHTLRPVISHVLPLAAAAEAHRIIEGGHAGGKIVLDVAGS